MKNKNQQRSSVQSLMQQKQLSLISENKWCNNINHVIQVTVESTLIIQNKPNKTNKIVSNNNRLLPRNSSTNSKLKWHFRERILNSIWVLKFIPTSSTPHKATRHRSYNKNSKNYMKCKNYRIGSCISNNSNYSSNRSSFNIKSLTLKLMDIKSKETVAEVLSVVRTS